MTWEKQVRRSNSRITQESEEENHKKKKKRKHNGIEMQRRQWPAATSVMAKGPTRIIGIMTLVERNISSA
jgi:hypothetical protein